MYVRMYVRMYICMYVTLSNMHKRVTFTVSSSSRKLSKAQNHDI